MHNNGNLCFWGLVHTRVVTCLLLPLHVHRGESSSLINRILCLCMGVCMYCACAIHATQGRLGIVMLFHTQAAEVRRVPLLWVIEMGLNEASKQW